MRCLNVFVIHNKDHLCLAFLQRYPGGFKQVTAAQLHHKDPTAVSAISCFSFLESLLTENPKSQIFHHHLLIP